MNPETKQPEKNQYPQAEKNHHPKEHLLRMDRIPHIWCPTCGIGTAVGALEELAIDLKKVAVVSGIGCTGRVAGYKKLDSFHTTHGRAVPFALGLHNGGGNGKD